MSGPDIGGLNAPFVQGATASKWWCQKKKQITASWHGALISPAGKRASCRGQEGVVLKGRKDTRQTQFRACFTGQRPRPTRPTRGANAATWHYPSSFRDFFPDFSDRGCTLLGYFDNQICASKRVAWICQRHRNKDETRTKDNNGCASCTCAIRLSKVQ